MNATYQKFADKGLVVLGVSDESRGLLEKYKEQFSVEYPMVSAPQAKGKYAITAYPTYMLVGADGNVISKGHPSDSQIESALKSVVMFPDIPKGAKLNALRKAVAAKKMANIGKSLTKLNQDASLSEGDKTVVDAVRTAYDSMIERTSAEIQRLGEGPDYFAAKRRLTYLGKQYKGLPVEAEVKAQLANFTKDPAIKKEIKISNKLAALNKKYNPKKRGDRKKLLKGLRSLIKKYEGSVAAKKAASQIPRIEKMR